MSLALKQLTKLLDPVLDPDQELYLEYRKALKKGIVVTNDSKKTIPLKSIFFNYNYLKIGPKLFQAKDNDTINFRKELVFKPIVWNFHEYEITYKNKIILKNKDVSWNIFCHKKYLLPGESFSFKETNTNRWNLWETIDSKMDSNMVYNKLSLSIKGEFICSHKRIARSFFKSLKIDTPKNLKEFNNFIENFDFKAISNDIVILETVHKSLRSSKNNYYWDRVFLIQRLRLKKNDEYIEKFKKGFVIFK